MLITCWVPIVKTTSQTKAVKKGKRFCCRCISARNQVTNYSYSYATKKYRRPDQILAHLRNIEEDVSEYDDCGSESDVNDSGFESNASQRPEFDSEDNTSHDELEENISGGVNVGFDSLECTRSNTRPS